VIRVSEWRGINVNKYFDKGFIKKMKLSISNIAWPVEHDDIMYVFLNSKDVTGLEIAPTRVFPHAPYEKPSEAKNFADRLKKDYNISISSIQSIWYGITESIFGSDTDRRTLIEYTKKAIDFTTALGCSNLVFGCPKNRAVPLNISPDYYLPIANDFFGIIGAYAADSSVYISIEPNPSIYNTNFINTTAQAFELCNKLDNPGIKVNLDVGTMIHNGESIQIIKDNINSINHVHISEPYLAPIKKRQLHRDLITELRDLSYNKFISIEMGSGNNIELVKNSVSYIKELCYDLQ